MKRNLLNLLSIAILIGLTSTATGCSLYTSSAKPDYSATQAAMLLQYTPVFNSPTPTIFPTPTLDPNFQTLTAQPTATFTPQPPAPKPATYTLKSGEFPYCIARRFNVHPTELLTLNHLTYGMYYSPGLILSIPQTGQPFPSIRAILSHPTTYTVQENQITVYKVACIFGDVDPEAIMQFNNLASPVLTIGQILKIP